MFIIRSGWAGKVAILADGRRQFVSILLPGDFATCEEAVAPGSSPPLYTLTDIEICVFDRDRFMDALQKIPNGVLGLWQACSRQVGDLRRLFVAMGQKATGPRLADFLVSLHDRLSEIGLVKGSQMLLPLRQIDIADIVGVSQVHVSRILTSLKETGVIRQEGANLVLQDLPALRRLANG